MLIFKRLILQHITWFYIHKREVKTAIQHKKGKKTKQNLDSRDLRGPTNAGKEILKAFLTSLLCLFSDLGKQRSQCQRLLHYLRGGEPSGRSF